MKGGINKIMRNIASKQGCNEFERRMIKATYGHDTKPPKEKHVIFLLTVMHGSLADVSCTDVVAALYKRCVEQHNVWSVNMKVLIVFHRLLQDKLLSGKVMKELKDKNFEFPSFYKEGASLSQSDRVITMISRGYAEYLADLCKFLEKSKFKSLTRDFGLAQVTMEGMERKDVLKLLKRLQKLVERLMIQLDHKDICVKNKLHACYMSHIFMDLTKAYTMYYAGINLLKKKFKSLGSKRKVEAFENYEFFLRFTKEFKQLVSSFPCVYGLTYIAPEIYEPNPKTLRKLKKKIEKKDSAVSTKNVPQEMLDEQNNISKICQSEKYIENFFSERASSLNEEDFKEITSHNGSRIEVNEDTFVIDNLLLDGARQEVRKHTLQPQPPQAHADFDGLENQFSSDSNSSGNSNGVARRFKTSMHLPPTAFQNLH